MIILTVVALLVLAVWLFLRSEKFGALPRDQRLERIRKSAQFKKGAFENQSPTPDFTDGANVFTVLYEFIFKGSKQKYPPTALPSIKTNLADLPEADSLVWFGHSSYFIKISGQHILVDPVLSGSASPLSFTTRAFAGSDIYTVSDLPQINFLILTHDHWDHLDYKTIMEVKPKVSQVICSLGVGAHLERWGYSSNVIHELDWHEKLNLNNSLTITATPARHFSGRTFKRNQSLWSSFVLTSASLKIFIGGDGGYDNHFEQIGKQHGPFDWAILECGQYNKNWRNIHLMPEEVVQAAIDLKAKSVLPVHWGKFSLSNHSWKEPIERVSAAAEQNNLAIATPHIGERVFLNEKKPYQKWWALLL